MQNYNSPESIAKWAKSVLDKALKESKINQHDYDMLMQHAKTLIDDGQWRGNISEYFKSSGFGSDILDDLYL